MNDPDDLRLTWIGHGTVLLQAQETHILIDPVLRDRVAHLRRRTPIDRTLVERVDAVLITHAHHDHLDLWSLRQLPRDVPVFAPRGADRVLRAKGLGDLTIVSQGDELDVAGVTVETVHARHAGSRVVRHAGDEAVGFVVRAEGQPSVYVGGDTAYFDELDEIGPVDVAVLPVGGWWRSAPSIHHLDPARAVDAAVRVGARVLVPIHWGTFHPIMLRRFMEATWMATPVMLHARITQLGTDLELRVLDPGETLALERSLHHEHAW